MKISIIYCDLDDVIVDYTSASLALHGWTRQKFEALRRPGVWNGYEVMKISADAYWEPIHKAGPGFWESLPELPHAAELITILQRFGNWGIATSPSRSVASWVGKANYLHARFTRAVVGNSHICFDKAQLAVPGSLLIDDRQENVERFIEAGGQGIVFPTRGNELYQLADNPVGYVRRTLEAKRCI